jgi:hypothetical protein
MHNASIRVALFASFAGVACAMTPDEEAGLTGRPSSSSPGTITAPGGPTGSNGPNGDAGVPDVPGSPGTPGSDAGSTNESGPAAADAGSANDSGPVVDTGTPDTGGNGTPVATRQCNTVSATTEEYGLAAPSTPPSGVSFLSDWGNRARAGGFSGIQVMDACRYHVDSNFHTWHGRFAVRVEVNPGDDPIGSGGERSEVLTMQDSSKNEFEESSASGDVFIATSYYFPATWDGTFLSGDGDSWSAVMQFHPSGSSGYFAGLQAGRRQAGAAQKFYFAGDALHEFSDGGQIVLGKWTDLVLEFNFGTGALRIYRRNEGQTKFTKVVDAVDSSMTSTDTTYFKQGLYRGPDVNGRTDVLWVGPTARGGTFAAVESASFGTSNGF